MFLALGPAWPITEKKQKRSVRPPDLSRLNAIINHYFNYIIYDK